MGALTGVDISNEMSALARYISDARYLEPPIEVIENAKIHLLDSIAAVVSGSVLPAGVRARAWVEMAIAGNGGGASVLGRSLRTSPFGAALANGMAAHAGETDDSHAQSLSHPGCSLVPAAIATGEVQNSSGADLLRAIIVAYDVGCRVGRSVKSAHRDRAKGLWSSHSVVGTFCSAAASGALMGFTSDEARYLLSYASQLASGVTTWVRDSHHIEKAFVFAGMPASNGVLASSMIAAGCDGVSDIFSGSPNWLEAMHDDHEIAALAAGLGTQFEINATTIKKYAVGSPSQAAVEAMVELIRDEALQADEVEAITIKLPSESAVIVDNRAMANVNVQYLLAGTLLDGGFTAAMSHDQERLSDPQVRSLMNKMTLQGDESIANSRAATLIVLRRKGETNSAITRTVRDVRGTPRNPMTWQEVQDKAIDLMGGVLGADRSHQICRFIAELDASTSVRELASMTVPQ